MYTDTFSLRSFYIFQTAAYHVESQKQSEKVRNKDTDEQWSLLKIEMEDTSVSPPTMRHEDEGNITGEKRKVLKIKTE